MPEIEHHDLVLFADQKVNLKKDEVDDQRAQVNRLRDRLVTAAAEALDTISTAYYEPAKGQAAELWQDVLGTGFQAAAA